MSAVAIAATPSPVGASFYTVNAGGAAVETCFAPAANTAGALVRTISAVASSASNAAFADTAAPSGVGDATKRQIWVGAGGNDGNAPFPLFVPAGQGLYLAHGAGGIYSATWDFL